MNIVNPNCWPPVPACPPFPTNPIAPPGGCTCGCDPCQCGGGLTQCWNDIQALKQIIAEVIQSMGGPVNTGPIQGVVDGSDAKPGDVGEWVSMTGSMNYAAAVETSAAVSVGVLQPGDWDLFCYMGLTTAIGVGVFESTPTPPGLSNLMQGLSWTAAPDQIAFIIGSTARGSFSVPTLLPFSVTINQSTTPGLGAGTAYVTVNARRVR